MANLSATAFAPAPDRAIAAIRLGDVFSRSRKAFAAHWIAYCAIMTLGYAPMAIVAALPTESANGLREYPVILAAVAIVVLVGLLACLSLIPAAISIGVVEDINGRGFSFGRCLRGALRRAPAVLALMISIGLAGMLGLVLIAPGAMIFCLYSVAIPACVIEGLGPLRSLPRSAFLTKGNRWQVLSFLFVIYIGGGALGELANFAATRVADDMIGLALSLPIEIFVGAFSSVALAVLYMQLRVAREGVDIDHIAKVFD
jgi:hypothetical protein